MALYKCCYSLSADQIVFIVKLLILLRNISRLHWSRELYSLKVSRYDTAEARAYFGVDEFGELH